MKDVYDLIILGGGPAGYSAAIYAGRAKLKTLVIDKERLGGQIRITSEVVNYPGIIRASGTELMEQMRTQVKSFGVEGVSEKIKELQLEGDIKTIITEQNTYKGLGVIVALGAGPRKLNFEGEDTFSGRGIGYCATCDGEFFTGLDIFVIGAGFAAAEEALFLTRYARKVYIIAREPDFTCSQTIADKVRKHDKIEVHYNTEIQSVSGDQVPRRAVFKNRRNGEIWEYAPKGAVETFGIFVFAGYEPMSGLVGTQLQCDEAGYIQTDEDLKTSLEGVYAAGDIRPKKLRQLVTAVADGAVAATNIEKYIEDRRQALGLQREKPQESPGESVQAAEEFFSPDIKAQLKDLFGRFENRIAICAVLKKEDALSKEINGFLHELKALSDKIDIEILAQGENPARESEINANLFPLMALMDSAGSYTGIQFHGVPGGHEFNSFVIALYNTAGPGQKIDPDILKHIRRIHKKINLKIGVTLSCNMCPDVVGASQQIALYNPNVEAEMIDISKFQEFKTSHNIMSVPAIVINDTQVAFGKKNVSQIIELIHAFNVS